MTGIEPDSDLKRELWRLFVKHNPLYLLSAGCMLAGCYVLSATLPPVPGHVGGLLGLLAVLNAYEALLIACGLFLVTRRALPRDGRTLLLLAAVFLFDATHLYAEAASDPHWGLLLACAAFLAGGVKIHVVARALRLELPLAQLSLVAAGFASVLVLPPGLAGLVRAGRQVDELLYSSWWALGLLVVMQSLATPAGPAADPDPAGVSPRRAFRRALAVLPAVSLVLHLFALSWLYDAPFRLCHLGPLGLALTLCAVRSHPDWFPRTRLVLPTICVVVTAFGCWSVAAPQAALSPLSAAGLLAGLIHLEDHRRNRNRAAAGLAALYLVVGPVVRFWDDWVRFMSRIVPATAAEWGRVGVGAAFVLLGLGLLLSLLKSHRRWSETPAEG